MIQMRSRRCGAPMSAAEIHIHSTDSPALAKSLKTVAAAAPLISQPPEPIANNLPQAGQTPAPSCSRPTSEIEVDDKENSDPCPQPPRPRPSEAPSLLGPSSPVRTDKSSEARVSLVCPAHSNKRLPHASDALAGSPISSNRRTGHAIRPEYSAPSSPA